MSYSAFRTNGFPTYYGENKHPVTADVLIAGILFAFAILAFSLLIVVPGIRGSEKVSTFVRITVSLLIGAAILLCNYGQAWEVGEVETKTQYKAFTSKPVKADVGIKIGLRGVNVTLVGKPVHQLGERIQYNERFSWEWAQGRLGFGSQAGRISREFRAAQFKGLPYPILWIAEYFTIDGEGIRFGRHYRTAGWYCSILLWTAFPLWILSNILFFMVIRYGAYFLSLTGLCLIAGNIVYASIRNYIPLVIPMGNEILRLKYGWSFWINLLTGVICVLLGTLIMFLDLRHPEKISTFFGIDVLQDYEEFYADPRSLEIKLAPTEDLPGTSAPTSEETYGMRKRTISSRFQRGSIRVPVPLPRNVVTEELPVYENLELRSLGVVEEEDNLSRTGSEENIVMQKVRR